MFFFNALMWTLFVKSLRGSSSSATATVINTGSNFICTVSIYSNLMSCGQSLLMKEPLINREELSHQNLDRDRFVIFWILYVKDTLKRTEWGLTLTGQEERQNFLKSQPSNQKEQEVATLGYSDWNLLIKWISFLFLFYNMKMYFFNLWNKSICLIY